MSYYSNSCWQTKAHHSLTTLTYASVPTHIHTVTACKDIPNGSCCHLSASEHAVRRHDPKIWVCLCCWQIGLDVLNFNREPAVLEDRLPLYLSCTVSIQVSGKTAAVFHYYSPVISHQPYRITQLSPGSWYMCWLCFFYTCSSEVCGSVWLIHHI